MNKSDPLTVLLKIKKDKGFQVSDELLEECYKLQSDHQYDKDRITLDKMKALIEETLLMDEKDILL